MKKLLFAIVAITATTFSSQAQSLHAGVKLGANLNKVDGYTFKEKFTLGFQLGGFAEIDISKKIGIQPELLWNQSKLDTVLNADYQFKSKDINLNYLTIPILLRYNVAKILTLHAGPQFGILLNKDKTLLEDGRNAFKSGDFSMILGAQLNVGSFRIHGRYNIGLTNLNDIDNKDKWKNQQIQLGVGLKLL